MALRRGEENVKQIVAKKLHNSWLSLTARGDWVEEFENDEDFVEVKRDGSYLLKTDRKDLSANEAWRIYTLLTRAEAAVRALKSPLGERPIFPHKEGRVEAHISLCVLAYHLRISIEKTLLDAGVHASWATVRETLKTHQVNPAAGLLRAGRPYRGISYRLIFS
jgi:transposase